MFLKMLRKDLKIHKGLNIIILVFITFMCILTTAFSMYLFGTAAGRKITADVTCMPDLSFRVIYFNGEKSGPENTICSAFESSELISDYECTSIIPVNYSDFIISSPGPDLQYMRDTSRGLFLAEQPRRYNLVYNTDNEAFTLKSGEIAVPWAEASRSGLEPGEKTGIITDTGQIFWFTVKEVYKTPDASMNKFILLNRNDFEVIMNESLYLYGQFRVKAPDKYAAGKYIDNLFITELAQDAYARTEYNQAGTSSSNTRDIILAITVFMGFMCVFMIFIVVISIRFTLISAVKSEIKEIGMMKAIGVNSSGFRLLFSAKYLGFSVFGAVIGITAGIPFAFYLLKQFSPDILLPGKPVFFAAAFVVMLIFSVLTVIHLLAVMKITDRISVTDALHGENRGERFRKLPGLSLHKCRFISPELFMALSDITGGIKRYTFLIVVYVFAAAVMLTSVNLDDTIKSPEYMKYIGSPDNDFSVYFGSTETQNQILAKGGTEKMIMSMNEQFRENGIPAELKTMSCSYASVITDETEDYVNSVNADIMFGDYSTENFTFRKGGTCPVLKNEVALSYNFAKEYGFSVGSIIKLCYSVKPSDDYLIHDWVTEEFTVTGLTDMFGHTVIMGNDFENASADFVRVVSGKIEGNSRQKALYLKKIQEISGENTIISGREAVSNEADYMYPVTGLLKFVLSAVSLLTIALVTVMYYKVIIHEDKRSVLLMRCIGTGKTKIKKWQLLRTLILILISFAAAVIFTKTAGNAVMSYGFGQAGCSGVRFIENPLHVWCAVPASVLAAVCISLAVCMRDINKTELRDVCSE